MDNKDLKRRIIEISYKNGLSHLSSCLTAVDILADIYEHKKPEDKVVLSQGHAGLALYVVLENYYQGTVTPSHLAETLFHRHGVHPNRDLPFIDCSAGSLGQGLPIALGMAIGSPFDVHCVISDGECAEGSIWEALRIKTNRKVDNLKVHLNANGFSAYDFVDPYDLIPRLIAFDPKIEFHTTTDELFNYELPFLKNVDAHYKTMTEEEYKKALEVFS